MTWTVTAANYDNCGVPSVVSTPPSGSTFGTGPNTVTTMATDTSGNRATNFMVTVIDTQAPVVTVLNPSLTLDVGGACNVAVPDMSTNITASDNCTSYTITQSPAAGTLISLGATNVAVVVTDGSGNSVTNTVALNVMDTQRLSARHLCGRGLCGAAIGHGGDWPAAGGTGTHYIGCDAFATVQGGINRVATNGTVNVAAGRYVENLSVDQPLSLLGPNAAINPNAGARVAEASAPCRQPPGSESIR